MSGCDDIASPTVGPSPLTRLNTPGGTPGRVQDFGPQDGAERRDFGRLQHHRAAGGDGRGDLAHDLVDRPVPRRDQAADADRLARDQSGALPRLECEVAEGRGSSPASARCRTPPARRARNGAARPFPASSHRRSRRTGARIRARIARSRSRRCARLVAENAGKSGARGGHGPIHVRRAAHADRGARLLGCRVDHHQRRCADRGHPIAADVEVPRVLHRSFLFRPPSAAAAAIHRSAVPARRPESGSLPRQTAAPTGRLRAAHRARGNRSAGSGRDGPRNC